MRRNPVRQKALAGLVFVWASLAVTPAQTAVKDISVIYADGKVTGNQYRNDYFGLTLTPVGGKFTQGGFISPQGKRARLIDVEANAKNWEDKYSLAILADALSVNPLIHSPDQYLRSVRHQLEREGLVTVQEESPVEISGLRFFQATMKSGGPGPVHFQGMYATFLNGYIVSLQVEAPSQSRLKEILAMVTFKVPR